LKEAGSLGLRDGGDVRIWFGESLARELAAGDVGEVGRALDALDPDVPVDVVVAGICPVSSAFTPFDCTHERIVWVWMLALGEVI